MTEAASSVGIFHLWGFLISFPVCLFSSSSSYFTSTSVLWSEDSNIVNRWSSLVLCCNVNFEHSQPLNLVILVQLWPSWNLLVQSQPWKHENSVWSVSLLLTLISQFVLVFPCMTLNKQIPVKEYVNSVLCCTTNCA